MSSQEAATGISRQERRKNRTRQALVEAVRELVAAKGADELTITQIAEAADVGIGSFYNHFESKQELVRAAAAELFAQVDELIDRAITSPPPADPAESIAVLVLLCLRQLEPNIVWAGFFASTSTERPMVSSPLAARALRELDRGHRDGMFEIPPAIGAFLLVGAVNSSLRAMTSGFLPAAQADLIARSVLRELGLSPAKARSASDRAVRRIEPTPSP